MNGTKIIIRKELTRVFRDKKLIFSLFILPAAIIVGMYALIGQMVTSMESDVVEHVSLIAVQGAPENIDQFMKQDNFSDTSKVTFLGADVVLDEYKDQVLNGKLDLLVVFEDQFAQKAKDYKKAGDPIPEVTMYYNTTINYSEAAHGKFVDTVLGNMETSLLEQRLGNLELLTVFSQKDEIIVDEDKANGETLAMLLPYFITFLLFTGVMSLGVDAITGEKERGTMASMLLSPLKRGEIVAGKMISLAILSSISAVVYAGAMIAAMPMMSASFGGSSEGTETMLSLGIVQIFQLLSIMLLMVFLYVALVTLLSVLAKTAKEAASYVSPVYIVVIIAGLLTMFQGGADKPLYMYAIPVYGNAISIQNLMTNELTIPQYLSTLGGTAALILILSFLVTRAFNSEKIMFNA